MQLVKVNLGCVSHYTFKLKQLVVKSQYLKVLTIFPNNETEFVIFLAVLKKICLETAHMRR